MINLIKGIIIFPLFFLGSFESPSPGSLNVCFCETEIYGDNGELAGMIRVVYTSSGGCFDGNAVDWESGRVYMGIIYNEEIFPEDDIGADPHVCF